MAALAYDITRLVLRVFNRTPNGIDRVDFAMADHFLDARRGDRFGVLLTPFGPRLLEAAAAREAIDNIRRHWGEDDDPAADAHFREVVAAVGGAPAAARRVTKRRSGQFAAAFAWWRRHGLPLGAPPKGRLAADAAYLNVSQFPLAFDRFFRWQSRLGVASIFFVHDLLPLEFPEYFRPAERPRHARRLATLARRGRAAIVSTELVREALRRHLVTLGRRDMPILVAPLPADPIFLDRAANEAVVSRRPYFVVCGTIEPRKNHLLLLHAWRDLVARLGDAAPTLVIVGARGWENEHVVDLLERCPGLREHVVEAAGLTTPSLKRLMLGARALLTPSFAEGYGLPVVEALAAGAPVIAADIPAFRAIGGERLLTLDPTDGPKWRETIRAFAAADSPERRQLAARNQDYAAPAWPPFFAAIEEFIDTLKR